MRTTFGRALLLAVALALGACASNARHQIAAQPGDQERTLEFGGGERSYLLRLPPAVREGQPLPVLLAFHGGGGNAESLKRYSGLDAQADAHGYALIYPNGTGRFARRLLTWNAGACCGYAKREASDDVGFALAVLADVARDVPLDPTRVYATGHSNGAMMAYRLATEAAPRIAAIAPVAGADMTERFEPAGEVPVLHVHSTDDPRALYEGGLGPPFPLTGVRVEHRAVAAGLARWRERDGCTGETTGEPIRNAAGHTAVYVDFAPCRGAAAVALWRLGGGVGHGWPGGKAVLSERIVGPNTDVIDTSAEIFRFLPRFRKPDAPPLASR